jgi:lysophospholipase L1-like esterase
MLECLVLGDSIAVGIHQFRPECGLHAKVGINSRDWNNTFIGKNLNSGVTIISLGSNDHEGIKTTAELTELRQSVNSKRVIWILPSNKADKRDIVKFVAEKYGDTIMNVNKLSNDKVHPTISGYKELANATK